MVVWWARTTSSCSGERLVCAVVSEVLVQLQNLGSSSASESGF